MRYKRLEEASPVSIKNQAIPSCSNLGRDLVWTQPSNLRNPNLMKLRMKRSQWILPDLRYSRLSSVRKKVVLCLSNRPEVRRTK